MTHIKVIFLPEDEAGVNGRLYFQLSHDRKVRRVATDCLLSEQEWDKPHNRIKVKHSNKAAEADEKVKLYRERLNRIIDRMEKAETTYTIDDVVDEFNRQIHDHTVVNFMKSIIKSLKQRGKDRTSETYTTALNSFRRFIKNDSMMLEAITGERIEAYESFLIKRGVTLNTVSFYMRILRAAYNRAVELDIIEQRMPFRRVYTGIGKTVKRALPLDTVKRIRNLDLDEYPGLDYARDMFMMSFYMRGMSFIDMAFLCKSDLHNGYITYRRRKTGQQLTVAWTGEMQDILDKYPVNPTRYLLPIVRNPESNERNSYRNAAYKINYNLKKIAWMVGAKLPLTMYCARHSWATAARTSGIPVSIISEGMGHHSESTTRIYLASFDTSAVDGANEQIIRLVTDNSYSR